MEWLKIRPILDSAVGGLMIEGDSWEGTITGMSSFETGADCLPDTQMTAAVLESWTILLLWNGLWRLIYIGQFIYKVPFYGLTR